MSSLLGGASPTSFNDQQSGGTKGCVFQGASGQAGTVAIYCDPGQADAIFEQSRDAGGLTKIGESPERYAVNNSGWNGLAYKRGATRTCLIQVMASPSNKDQQVLAAAL
jgi:hypothetical protein